MLKIGDQGCARCTLGSTISDGQYIAGMRQAKDNDERQDHIATYLLKNVYFSNFSDASAHFRGRH